MRLALRRTHRYRFFSFEAEAANGDADEQGGLIHSFRHGIVCSIRNTPFEGPVFYFSHIFINNLSNLMNICCCIFHRFAVYSYIISK